MAKKIQIDIQDSEETLKKLIKNCPPHLAARANCLLLIKQGKVDYMSHLARQVGCSTKTIYNWLKRYKEGGLNHLIELDWGGKRFSKVSTAAEDFIKEKLTDPENGISGYNELLALVNEKFQEQMVYSTLYYHCTTHYKSKFKVPAKSHVKKDPEASEALSTEDESKRCRVKHCD